jgi:hypothetical protein
MAIAALARDVRDLEERLGRIIVGSTRDRKPIRAADLKAAGAMTLLLKDAIHPNLVQTLEGGPALVHCGPFGNIAHGCNSVVATDMALSSLPPSGRSRCMAASRRTGSASPTAPRWNAAMSTSSATSRTSRNSVCRRSWR